MEFQTNNYIFFHQDFSKAAGTERVLYNIIEHLVSKNANVTLVLASKRKKLVFDIEELPIKIIFLDCEIITDNKFSLLKSYYYLFVKSKKLFKEMLKSKMYTIIASNHLLAACAYFSTFNMKNFRIISCEHFSYHIASSFSKILRKVFYSKVSVVVLTKSDCELIRRELSPKICVCIPNAVPFQLQNYSGENSKVIIAIGRYSHQKGFDLLIRAFATISEEFLDWKLIIVGDDYGEKSKMENLILEFNITNIELHPSTNRIVEYYKNASFYVMSSRYEGLPMVLLEAIGHGLPIVSFNCPTGPSEIIEDNSGVLVENGNTLALGQAMKRMMTNLDLRVNYSKGAEKKAIKFSKNEINNKWDDLLEEIWK